MSLLWTKGSSPLSCTQPSCWGTGLHLPHSHMLRAADNTCWGGWGTGACDSEVEWGPGTANQEDTNTPLHVLPCRPLEDLLTSLWCSAESSEQSVVPHLTCTTPPSCRVHCWCVWTVAYSGVQCSPACMHSSLWSHQHSMTATRRAATRLRLDWTKAGPTLPHSTLVHIQVTECSTATDTHTAGAQDGSQSALTAGPNTKHKHVHVIRTETAVCAHERGSGTRQHDSRHVMLGARTEGAAPNTILPSTQSFTILWVYCQ